MAVIRGALRINIIVALVAIFFTAPDLPAQVEEIDPMYDSDGEPTAENEVTRDEDDLPSYENDRDSGFTPEPRANGHDPSELGFDLDSETSKGDRRPSSPHYDDDSPAAVGQDDAGDESGPDDPLSDPANFAGYELPAFHNRDNQFALKRRDPDIPRSIWWPALVSIPLPGFGQWYDGQYEWGLGYSGVAAAGIGLAATNVPGGRATWESDAAYRNRQSFGVTERKFMLGLQLYQTAGGFSAYHSFRTAVRTRQKIGQFGFLQEEETVSDILLAPFDFRFLGRMTTLVPLAVGGVLYVFVTEHHQMIDKKFERRGLRGSDVFFSSAYSFNAGTHEEAVFRGWVQPMFYHITGERSIWSNLITSGIFAAAHLPTNPAPLPQFALSLHMGWVTERNRWTIAESVFIHTWWDVIAFLAQHQLREREGPDSKIEPALHLPPIEFRF